MLPTAHPIGICIDLVDSLVAWLVVCFFDITSLEIGAGLQSCHHPSPRPLPILLYLMLSQARAKCVAGDARCRKTPGMPCGTLMQNMSFAIVNMTKPNVFFTYMIYTGLLYDHSKWFGFEWTFKIIAQYIFNSGVFSLTVLIAPIVAPFTGVFCQYLGSILSPMFCMNLPT